MFQNDFNTVQSSEAQKLDPFPMNSKSESRLSQWSNCDEISSSSTFDDADKFIES